MANPALDSTRKELCATLSESFPFHIHCTIDTIFHIIVQREPMGIFRNLDIKFI